MIKYKKFLFILVFFLIQISLVKAEPLQYKRIVVMPSNITYKNIPYDTNVWQPKYNEIILTAGSNAKVIRNSPKYAYVTLSIPESEYNQTIESLKEKGYVVRDEFIQKILLNDSLPLIGAPYNPGSGTLTGAGRIVAVIDTGIDCNHPDINDCNDDGQGKLLHWYNTFDSPNPVIFDDNGHGTHVASILAGTGANSSGKFKGVASGASLIIARACDANDNCPTTNIVQALEWINNSAALPDAVSMSLGAEVINHDEYIKFCTGQKGGEVTEEYDFIKSLTKRGAVVVAAAGNEGVRPQSIDFPACINEIVAVGSVYDRNDGYLEYLSDGVSDVPQDVAVHVIVNISGGHNENYTKEWIAPYYEHATGFQQSFFITSPTTVRVRVEGFWKSVYGSPCLLYGEGWEPGGNEKGDSYWEWNQTISPISQFQGNYVNIEVAMRPFFTGLSWWPLNCYWTGWDGGKHKNETMIVRIYPSWFGLRGNLFLVTARGPGPNNSVKPDVVAPGVGICAARAAGTGSANELVCGNNNYVAMSGSSMATPQVAGLVALLKQYRPSSTFDEIVTSIKRGAVGTDFPDFYREGAGLINVRGSVGCLATSWCRSSGSPSTGIGGGGSGSCGVRPLCVVAL